MSRPIRLRFLTLPVVAAFLTLGAAPGAAAAQPTKIVISYAAKTVDFLPLQIANDVGYFKKHGLDVTLRYLPAQEGIPALITGQTQMAGIGGTDANAAEAQGEKFELVATLTPVYDFQFWARPKYASANALKGQRVGITSTAGSLYAATVLALKALGLKTSEVAITPLGGVTNVDSSLAAGSVVAAVAQPPATYQFERAGFVDLVNLATKKIPSVSAGLWITQSYMKAHRAVVQDVVDAVTEALRRETSDRVFAESEMTKHLGVKNKAELDFTYDFYVNDVLPAGPMPQVAQIESNQKSLSEINSKLKTIDAAAMVDQSFVKNAEK